jgi:hypothetical protein
LPDGLSFDALSVEQDGLCSAEEDIGGCHVVRALMVAAVVVVLDKGVDPRFELAGKVERTPKRLNRLLPGRGAV